MERVTNLASQHAVVVFSNSSCGMCHAIKRLFCELGVNAAVYEVDEVAKGKEMEKALAVLIGRKPPLPAVFIGGRLVGRNEEIMALHLSGALVELLKEAGGIWV